jgi:hypothetical protein
MRISYEAADEQYARIRMLRNTLIIAAAVLTALVAVVCIVGLRLPTAISHQLGLPVGSIGPTRARCLPKLAATTTIRALELGGSDSTSIAHAA